MSSAKRRPFCVKGLDNQHGEWWQVIKKLAMSDITFLFITINYFVIQNDQYHMILIIWFIA